MWLEEVGHKDFGMENFSKGISPNLSLIPEAEDVVNADDGSVGALSRSIYFIESRIGCKGTPGLMIGLLVDVDSD